MRERERGYRRVCIANTTVPHVAIDKDCVTIDRDGGVVFEGSRGERGYERES